MMKVICVSVNLNEIKAVAVPFAETAARLFVEQLFGPMIEPGSCKKVKK